MQVQGRRKENTLKDGIKGIEVERVRGKGEVGEGFKEQGIFIPLRLELTNMYTSLNI